MNKNKLQYFRNKLENEKKETLDSIERMKSTYPNPSMKDYFDELSMYDNHPADLGTEMFMAEQGMNLSEHEKLVLNEIEDSIEKIESGSYGQCDICGKEIGEERLDLVPYTKTCIDCANSKVPLDDMMDDRPVEEVNLYPPFGRTNTDVSVEDSVNFDGEDSYQAVARYNEVPGDPSNTTGDNQGVYDERESGIVEEVDQVSTQYYKGQLPGLEREDIPDEQMIRKNQEE